MSLVHLALRNRAMTVVAATTGLISLAATADGFVRTSGSFVDDGFAAGQEVIPSGFADNALRVVKFVEDLTLYTTNAPASDAANTNRSLTVGFPSAFARENADFDPPKDGRGYLEESFEELTQRTTGVSFDSPVEFTGNMRFRVYAPKNTGMLGARRLSEALRDLFPKGFALVLADGSIVRARNDFLPTATNLGVLGTGFSVYVVTIPWRREFPA